MSTALQTIQELLANFVVPATDDKCLEVLKSKFCILGVLNWYQVLSQFS